VRIFSFDQQEQLLQPDWRPAEEAQLVWPFRSYWDERLDTVKAAQVFDLQTYLPEDILTKVDRASMHFGVEARVPLLARRVVEHALRTSTDLHRLGQRRKYLLKRAIEGRVPPSLLTNRKRGFSLPLEMAIGERVRAWAAAAERSALVQDGVIAPGALREFAGDLDKAWTLYALDGWWSRWIRQDRSSSGNP
jgi:asparagine synthase (glutamine-hydrolysing)